MSRKVGGLLSLLLGLASFLFLELTETGCKKSELGRGQIREGWTGAGYSPSHSRILCCERKY